MILPKRNLLRKYKSDNQTTIDDTNSFITPVQLPGFETYNYFSELVEGLSNVLCGDVFLKVADEESSCSLGMVLVQLCVVRTRLIILNIVPGTTNMVSTMVAVLVRVHLWHGYRCQRYK